MAAWLMKDPDFRAHIIQIQLESLFGKVDEEKPKIEYSS
jgi:hypothetical protein